MNLQPAQYKITYNGKNITEDVSDYLLSLSYTDKTAGESDEIELELHDKDLLWQTDWYPQKGSKVLVQLIDGDAVLDCGGFTIDEVEYKSERGSADTVTIRGMAAVITKALRSKKSSAHESKTLKELCNTVAAVHGLTVQGTIADIRISRVTQYRETDLSFLYRISEKYGYTFSVRDNLLVFTLMLDLYTKQHVLSLDKTESTSFSFKDSSKEVVKQVTVAYHNPSTNKVVTKTVTRDAVKNSMGFNTRALSVVGGAVDAETDAKYEEVEVEPSDEDLDNSAVDNDQLAEEVAKTIMQKSIVKEETVTISCPGNILIVTGIQVELTGFGRFSGIYYVIESNHSMDRASGYVTTFQANKTGKVHQKKHKAKKKKKSTDDDLPVEGPDYNESDDSENVIEE